MATKNSKRKYAAVALGIVGIAGLSLASAAQLNVNETSPLVGVGTENECDGAVDVAYTTSFAAGAFSVASIEVSDIHADCAGTDIDVYVLDDSGDQVGSATGTVDGTGSVTLTPAAAIDAVDVYQAAVAIS